MNLMNFFKYKGKLKLIPEYGFVFVFTLMRFYFQIKLCEDADSRLDIHMILRFTSWTFMYMSFYRQWSITNYFFKSIHELGIGGKPVKLVYDVLKS